MDWMALLSVALGGALAIGGGWAQAEYYRRRQRSALRRAIAAEVATIVAIARSRNYYQELLAAAKDARRVAGTFTRITIGANHNYFSVFEANSGAIGDLEPTLTADIIVFYQLTRSWLDAMSAANAPKDHTMTSEEAASNYTQLAGELWGICEQGD